MKKKVRRGVCRLLCGCMILFMSPGSIQIISAEETEVADAAESEGTAEFERTEVSETEALETVENKRIEESERKKEKRTEEKSEEQTEEQQEKTLEEMPDEFISSAYGSVQTWYPKNSGYFVLTVRDNAGGRTARYRIDCNIGERHPNGINYRIYYKMYLIGGDELGITLEEKEYYTRHDNATSEIGAREYHLPVTFRLPELGHHFEGVSTSDCYQTYFESMEEETCSFVVDTNGCGMTPWGDDGAWHNDNIEVNYLENRYTIHYDGNGATSGTVASQPDVLYGKQIQLRQNQYKKEYAVTFDGNGGMSEVENLTAESSFAGWEDHNSFYYNGIEFPWYAFDAPCYAKANPDLLESFGYNKAALLSHFYQYVIQGREKRISSPYFRLTDYMKYGGEDLKQAFGSRRESYLLHWINHGYIEHRVGIGTIGVPEALSELSVYEDKAQVLKLSSKHKGEVLLKAQWKDAEVILPSAKRSGYALAGWADGKDAKEPEYYPGDKVKITENQTFYAIWKKSKPPVIERMISIQNGTDGFYTYAYVRDGGDGISKTAFAVWSENQGQDDLAAEWQTTELGEEGDYFVEGQRYNYRYNTSAAKHKNEYGRHLISIYAYDNLDGYATADTDFCYCFPIIFDGNEGLIDGEETKQEKRYYGTPYGEMPVAVRENCFFLGWSTEPNATWQERELIGEEDIFCHVGEQRLYAQWDESPVIEAEDQYYSLMDARSGRITEEMLLQQACAKDKENSSEDNPEGILNSGADEEKNTVFCVEDYKEEEWKNFAHEGTTTITYYAKDAVGNISRKQVTVYLVDTASQQVKEKEKAFRFISEKYLDTITPDSIWKKEENYRQLEKALQRNTVLEVWNLSSQQLNEIKEYELQQNTGKMTEIERFRSKFIQCIGENAEI